MHSIASVNRYFTLKNYPKIYLKILHQILKLKAKEFEQVKKKINDLETSISPN